MEALSYVLFKESPHPKTGIGIKLSTGNERISCLLFTDDCLLFCKANNTACTKLKYVLDTCCNQSEQLINYHKSLVTFSTNATSDHRQVVAGIFNIVHSDSLGKYLGCLVFQKRLNTAICQELVEKAMVKLVGWKANCLSKAGRTVLIQSHPESLPAYTMQCFQLPTGVTNNIDRINREFFWKKNNTDKGLPLIAWDRVCKPKESGGLGLRKTAAVNKAFQCKLAWKIVTNQNGIWVSIMRDKYLKQQEFFDTHSKHSDWVVWRNIIRCKDLICQGIIWRLGDGKDIFFLAR